MSDPRVSRWGVVATIKAPLTDILGFAAHHLELGAHRLYIYLDAPDAATAKALSTHPRIRVRPCDAAYWKGRKRPQKHQVRQTVNATHAYRRAGDVDWLAHIDVDEFLCPAGDIGAALAALPGDIHTARVRPMERLAGSLSAHKGFIPPGPERARITARLYPTYGPYLTGGFLSHVAGKVFARTGMKDVTLRIHNVFAGDDMNPGLADLPDTPLAHVHAQSWPAWLAAYRHRLEKGSYRAELGPATRKGPGPHNMHDLFTRIENEAGEAGLAAFFEEVAADTPRLREALQREGLLVECALDLDAQIARHFPNI